MSFHQLYRPFSLRQIIGHQKAVSTLQGYIETGKFPSAILFTGPTSVGKTTLARAFANDVLGLDGPADLANNPNWFEINFGENRSIEDIRGMIQMSRLRPQNGASRRFILGDEAQQVLANAPAANAFLKPLEEPAPTTTFLLGSMEADKFKATQTGKAIANRCVVFNLEPPSPEALMKQAKRIAKGEGMTWLTADLLTAVVAASDSSMRNLANLMESLAGFRAGNPKKEITSEDLAEVIAGSSSNDDVAAVKFLTAICAGKFVGAQKALLEMNDGVTFINKLAWSCWFLLNSLILKGQRHPKVWGSQAGYALVKQVGAVFDDLNLPEATRVSIVGEINSRLVKLKLQSGAFAVDESLALSAFAWDTVQAVKGHLK